MVRAQILRWIMALFMENINSYGSIILVFDKWIFDRKVSALKPWTVFLNQSGELFPFTVSILNIGPPSKALTQTALVQLSSWTCAAVWKWSWRRACSRKKRCTWRYKDQEQVYIFQESAEWCKTQKQSSLPPQLFLRMIYKLQRY